MYAPETGTDGTRTVYYPISLNKVLSMAICGMMAPNNFSESDPASCRMASRPCFSVFTNTYVTIQKKVEEFVTVIGY